MSKRFAALGATLLLSLGTSTAAFADIGPKPTMTIRYVADPGVKFDYKSVTLLVPDLVPGRMHHDALSPLRKVGPQRVETFPDRLWAMAYGFHGLSAIEVTLDNGKILRSNQFSKKAFDAKYEARITQDEITVQEK